MRIKKIQLKNGYKRFHNLTIDLGENPKRVVALVGPNGCGKSSVLDGMLYLNSAHGGIGSTGGKGHDYHSMHGDTTFNQYNISIDFDEGDYNAVRNKRGDRKNTIFSFRSPYRFNQNLKLTQSSAVSEITHNSYGASTSADIDEKVTENYRRLLAVYTQYMKKEDCRPSEARSKIIGDLNNAISNCLNLKISDIGDIDENRGTLYFQKPDHAKEFQFNVLSSGEKSVIDILLDLYIRKDSYNETIFLLDEPELHINTSIQKKLLIEINKMVGEKCQLWITTHSIGFLRALQDELKSECQVILFSDSLELAKKEVKLTPIKPSHAIWREIFKIALDDLSHMITPKIIIYCEGKDRPGAGGVEKGLDATIFNIIFAEKYHDVLFVSSGGNTELDQRSAIAFSIMSKIIKDIEILVLKDRDMNSGKAADESTRQEYLGNNPQNHRVFNRYEIENYLYDKEVLKKYCTEEGKVFDENFYDQHITDIINQDVKKELGIVKKSCNIQGSINEDVFKKKLANNITENMAIYKELEQCIFERK